MARGSASWLSSHGRGLGPQEAFKKDSQGLSWVSRLPRGVRPRLEGKPRTPLSSRVATRVSWSPLSGLKGEGGGGARWGGMGAGGWFSGHSHSPFPTGMKTDGAVVTYSCYPPRALEKVSCFEYRILTVFLGSLTALSALLRHRFGLEEDHQFHIPPPPV